MRARTLEDWFRILEYRRRVADLDNAIVIDGDEGVGKSTIGVYIAKRLDPEFDPEDVVYNHEDWARVFDPHKKQGVYLIDEGGNLGFNRDWARREQKALMKFFMVSRQANATLIFAIPTLRWLDPYLREHRIHYRLHAYARGRAVVQRRASSWRTGSVWYEDEFKAFFPNLWLTHPVFMKAYKARKYAAFLAQTETGKSDTIVPKLDIRV